MIIRVLFFDKCVFIIQSIFYYPVVDPETSLGARSRNNYKSMKKKVQGTWVQQFPFKNNHCIIIIYYHVVLFIDIDNN